MSIRDRISQRDHRSHCRVAEHIDTRDKIPVIDFLRAGEIGGGNQIAVRQVGRGAGAWMSGLL